jgi:hypothetical protein
VFWTPQAILTALAEAMIPYSDTPTGDHITPSVAIPKLRSMQVCYGEVI